MITCPTCQTPNPDNATTCQACGAGLAEQLFAQALDRATQAPGESPAEAKGDGAESRGTPTATDLGGASTAAQAQAEAPLAAAAPAPAPVELGGSPAAQAQIDQFFSAQRARKRMRSMIWLMGFVAVAAVAGFFILRSARAKAKREAVAKFYLAFRQVDDQQVAEFWRCVVRAKHMDVRLAKDNLVLTDGLQKAFKNFPKSQPQRITEKCMPELATAVERLKKLETPEGFADPLDQLIQVLGEVGQTFESYVTKLAKRAQQTANEKQVLEAAAAFHVGEDTGLAQAVGYVMLMECAIPDFLKMAKKVKQAPDTQPVVEFLYRTCKEDPSFSEKLRKECFSKLTELAKNPQKPKYFGLVRSKMAGDDRDRLAIDYCFKRSNRGFFDDDINAVGKIWVSYRERRKRLMDEVFKYKEK